MKSYLLRSLRQGAGNSSTGSIEQATHGSGGPSRFWTDHVLTVEGDMTVPQASLAATWLIAGMRLISSPAHTWRRCIMAELREGESFDIDAPTWTLIPPVVPNAPYSPQEPPARFGRRLNSSDGRNTAGILNEHLMLSLHVNRRKGSAWAIWLPGSVGSDDVSGSKETAWTRRQGKYQLYLYDQGTAAEFCVPWLSWCWSQVPELDYSVDVQPGGELVRVAPASDGELMLTGVTEFSKMRRWQMHKSPEMRYLDDLFLRADTLLQQGLRAHGSADVGVAVQDWNFKRGGGEIFFLQAAYLWREFAPLLGMVPPVGVIESLGATRYPQGVDVFTMVNYDYSPSDFWRRSGPEILGTLQPVTVPGRVTVTKNRAQIKTLIERLLVASEWYHANIDTRYNSPTLRYWRLDADGSQLYQIWDPRLDGPITDYKWSGYARLPGQQDPATGKWTPPPWEFPLSHADRYAYQDVYVTQRQNVWLNWKRWDEFETWIFTIVNALNWLDILLRPQHSRPRLASLKDMKLEVPRVPPVPAAGLDTLPDVIEIAPWIMHHRQKRGPWLLQGRGGPPPPNEVTLQTTPPPPPTAAQIKAKGDLRRREAEDYAKWKAQRAYGQKLVGEGYKNILRDGVIDYTSDRTTGPKFIQDPYHQG